LGALGDHFAVAMEILLECKRQRSRPAGGGCGLYSKKVSVARTAGRVTVRWAGSGALLRGSVAFCELRQTVGAKPHEVAQHSRLHPTLAPGLGEQAGAKPHRDLRGLRSASGTKPGRSPGRFPRTERHGRRPSRTAKPWACRTKTYAGGRGVAGASGAKPSSSLLHTGLGGRVVAVRGDTAGVLPFFGGALCYNPHLACVPGHAARVLRR